jgi:hypothetical protein
MTHDQRITALEDAVRKLAAVVQADIESLRVTDDEVARQTNRFSPGWGWPRTRSR